MPDLHIHRTHTLGLEAARGIALRWCEDAQQRLGLQCRHVPGEACDTIAFERTGVSGTLVVAGDRFELRARLGFLLSAFSTRIEDEIGRNLDALLSQGGRPPSA
jgi:putative polyhydroxyalkanoate system protein